MAKKAYDYDEMLKKYGVEASGEKPKEVGDEEWEKYRMAYLQKSAAEDVDAELSRAKEQAAVSQELARGYLAQYLKGTGLGDIGVSQSAILESEANYYNNIANLEYSAAAEKRQIDRNYANGTKEITDKWADIYLKREQEEKAKALEGYNWIVGNLSQSSYTADEIKAYIDKYRDKAVGYDKELDDLVAESYKQEEENYKKQLSDASSIEALYALNENYSDATKNKFINEYKQKEDAFYPEGKGKIVGASRSYRKMNSKGSQRLNAIDFGGKTYELKFIKNEDAYNENESAAANLPNPADYSAGTILAIEKDGNTTYWYRGNTYQKWYRMVEWKK